MSYIRKGLLKAHHDRCCSLLSIVPAISTYLNMLNQCLTMLFSKNFVSLKRSPLYQAIKEHKTIEKVKMPKIIMVNRLS